LDISLAALVEVLAAGRLDSCAVVGEFGEHNLKSTTEPAAFPRDVKQARDPPSGERRNYCADGRTEDGGEDVGGRGQQHRSTPTPRHA
jgi:hypothetical protein